VAGGVSAMAVMGRFLRAWVGRFVILLLLLQLCVGDDIVHNDDQEPKQPGCNNSYVLVSHLYRLLPLPTEATKKGKEKILAREEMCLDFVCMVPGGWVTSTSSSSDYFLEDRLLGEQLLCAKSLQELFSISTTRTGSWFGGWECGSQSLRFLFLQELLLKQDELTPSLQGQLIYKIAKSVDCKNI